MNLQQTQDLTVESSLVDLLYRMVDFSNIPPDEYPFDFNGKGETKYEKLQLHFSLEKPLLSMFEDELVIYKAELTAAEEARLAEIARVQDIMDRFDVLRDVTGALAQAGIQTANWALERNRIIAENDQNTLASIEAADFVVQQNQEQRVINDAARKYLKETDWYIIRELESGIACPIAIKDQRNAARLAVV